LAERLRPTILSSYIGQSDLVGTGSLLRSMLETPSTTSSSIGSLILWGPPGCGKTTLARLIASQAEADFKELSATSSGTGDVRKVFEQAKNQLRLLGRRTILFIGAQQSWTCDEIINGILNIDPSCTDVVVCLE
jgi:putative ATPase